MIFFEFGSKEKPEPRVEKNNTKKQQLRARILPDSLAWDLQYSWHHVARQPHMVEDSRLGASLRPVAW